MTQKTILLSGNRHKSTFARIFLKKRENISLNFGEFGLSAPGIENYFKLKKCKDSYIVKVTPDLILDWLDFSEENDLVILEPRDVLETLTSKILSNPINNIEKNTRNSFKKIYDEENHKITEYDIKLAHNQIAYYYLCMASFILNFKEDKRGMRLRYLPQTTLLKDTFEYSGVQKIWHSTSEKLKYINNDELVFKCIDDLSVFHERCLNALSILEYDEIII